MDESMISLIERLAKLNEQGALSEEEFKVLKEALLKPIEKKEDRLFDRDGQLKYICELLPNVMASLEIIANSTAELYSMEMGGRKKARLKFLDHEMSKYYDRQWKIMIDKATKPIPEKSDDTEDIGAEFREFLKQKREKEGK